MHSLWVPFRHVALASLLGLAFGAAGQTGRAAALRDELLARGDDAASPTALALVSFGLGDLDETFRWLDRAIALRDPHVIPIRSYPPLAAVRADTRYASVLARLKLDATTPQSR